MTNTGFKIDENKGFKITFDNGVTVSVQFGGGNYCNNRVMTPLTGIYIEGQECVNAEVAIWDSVGGWITQQYDPELLDEVIGHCTAAEVLKILIWAEVYKGERTA